MRFTFAAATLFGYLLSTDICAAKPISARRDLSSISEGITARSATKLITPIRRGSPTGPHAAKVDEHAPKHYPVDWVELGEGGGEEPDLPTVEHTEDRIRWALELAKVIPSWEWASFKYPSRDPQYIALGRPKPFSPVKDSHGLCFTCEKHWVLLFDEKNDLVYPPLTATDPEVAPLTAAEHKAALQIKSKLVPLFLKAKKAKSVVDKDSANSLVLPLRPH
ncbi:hypothetical protein BDP27DRAFT_1401233 [Rhodocollybia butyracea]|uniref:Uncharacterized protein n=1 Tax=Rhodocollybia butyracea TaxID=206335 RepID=A0A9P5PT75_9AGAR|nr:hypothetical protein BDP27DRAFT_1401233 [Rhodocollybia butyracea]